MFEVENKMLYYFKIINCQRIHNENTYQICISISFSEYKLQLESIILAPPPPPMTSMMDPPPPPSTTTEPLPQLRYLP